MTSERRRILYIEKPPLIGGSVISLGELVRSIDTGCYEPIVLFLGPNPYHRQLQKYGVKVVFLNGQPEAKAGEEQPPVVSKRDIAADLGQYSNKLRHSYRLAKQLYLMGRRDWPLARRVARLIKRESIDLVHHNNTLPGNRATILAARLAGVPQICHVRMLHEFSVIEKRLAGFVNQFIYISQAVEQLYQRLGIPANRGKIIYDPINIDAFAQADDSPNLRSEFGLTGQDRLITNVGRLDWWKGQDYFLQAMALVVRSQPNTKALIVGSPAAGSRSQVYYQHLQQLTAELQLTDHVIFTGFRSDIPQIMAASDLVVHSSSEPEPFGRVVVEAMAAGRPVVATAAGGVLDIIEDRVTGWLVPPKNALLMAEAMQQLLQDDRCAARIGQRAQQQVKERFTINRHVAAIEDVYQRVLSIKKSYGCL